MLPDLRITRGSNGLKTGLEIADHGDELTFECFRVERLNDVV